MKRQLKRLKVYCDTLLSCEQSPSLSKEEVQAFKFGRKLIREALQDVKEYQKSCSPTALSLMGDLVYATSLMARFLPSFPFQDTHKRHGAALSAKAAEKKAPAIDKRKRLLKEKGYDLEALAKSRKHSEAIVSEFALLCDVNGVKPVGGKQLQKYARELLKEGREIPGTS